MSWNGHKYTSLEVMQVIFPTTQWPELVTRTYSTTRRLRIVAINFLTLLSLRSWFYELSPWILDLWKILDLSWIEYNERPCSNFQAQPVRDWQFPLLTFGTIHSRRGNYYITFLTTLDLRNPKPDTWRGYVERVTQPADIMWTEKPIQQPDQRPPVIWLQLGYPAISTHWSHHDWDSSSHHRAKMSHPHVPAFMSDLHNRQYNETVVSLLR